MSNLIIVKYLLLYFSATTFGRRSLVDWSEGLNQNISTNNCLWKNLSKTIQFPLFVVRTLTAKLFYIFYSHPDIIDDKMPQNFNILHKFTEKRQDLAPIIQTLSCNKAVNIVLSLAENQKQFLGAKYQ